MSDEKKRLDFGCGKRPKDGFLGVDNNPSSHAVYIADLLKFPFIWRDSSVDEIRCEHFIEHIPAREVGEGDLTIFGNRQDMIGQDMFFAFFDECYRVLRPDSPITLIWPALQSSRAFKDPTHRRFIPMETMAYLNLEWRMKNDLSHYHVNCDFRIVNDRHVRQQLWNVEGDFEVTLMAQKGG